MIQLLGTSHVSPQSIKKVREQVQHHEIIAVELDRQRAQTLLNNETKKPSLLQLIRAVGLSGAIFAKIGHYVEKKIGASVGTTPGGEMKAAIYAAAQQKKMVALIDQPIQITLQRFSKSFTWRVKLKLLKTVFKKTKVRFDVREEPDEETIKELLIYVEQAVPELAEVLIHERNRYMAQRLVELQERHPDKSILAVVGAGHLPGLREELNTRKEEISP